jgi:hypothetical protein
MLSTRTILAVVVGIMIGFAARALVAPVAAQVDSRSPAWVTALPAIYSGTDIGVRITGGSNTGPTGQIVVRINGVWQQVQF